MKTQKDKILNLLKANGPLGVYPTELTETLHITQPLARINGLREDFGCSHKHGNKACLAIEHIENRRVPNGHTKYFYFTTRRDYNTIIQEAREVRSQQIGLL